LTSRRIAHFELHELLGEGAMGKVYRAIDLELERPVAIKVLGARTVNDPAFIERFKREARLAAQLNHPHIATIYAFGEENGEAYIAMEFVEGETLTERLARGPLPLAEVRKFGRQTAAALAVAHEKGIVHRDIKPGNLMINRQGELKVMDFGVARRSGETELTMAGSLIGTANIMAPELVRGGAATPAADLFSLGCVLYEMLTGRPAFEGETALAILFRVANDEPEALENLRTETPPELRDLVKGLLIKDPERRLGPASAVLERLGDNATLPPGGTLVLPAGGAGTLVLPTGVTIPKPDAGRRRRVARLIMAGLVLVVAVTMAGLWLLTRNSGRKEAKRLTDVGETLSNSDAEQAQSLFHQAIQADSSYARAWNNLGLLIMSTNRDDAIEAFTKAAELDEGYPVPRFNLAELYRRRNQGNDIQKAQSFYDDVIRMGKSHVAEAYWGRARVKEGITDLDGAKGDYKSAIQAKPKFAAAYNDLGYLFLKMTQADSAETYLLAGLKLDPAPNEAAFLWKNLGEARRQKNDLDGADSAYVKALELKTDFSAALAGRALVAERSGLWENARKYWREVEKDRVLADSAGRALDRLQKEGH
jgi:Tfp pilus assembly protein PilF/predicted Ser/Thr protein kinase